VSAAATAGTRAERDERLGLPATVALVVGGIVGTGIFTVPAAVANYGWLSLPAFAVVGAGSLAIALSFAQLVRRTRSRAPGTSPPWSARARAAAPRSCSRPWCSACR